MKPKAPEKGNLFDHYSVYVQILPLAATMEVDRGQVVTYSRSGPEAADSANEELPDRLDLDSDTDARLLRKRELRNPKARMEVQCSAEHVPHASTCS